MNKNINSKPTFKIIIGVLLGIPICAFLWYVYFYGFVSFARYADYVYNSILQNLFFSYFSGDSFIDETIDYAEHSFLIICTFIISIFSMLYVYIKFYKYYFSREINIGIIDYLLYFIFIFSLFIMLVSKIYSDIKGYEIKYFFEHSIIIFISLIITYTTSVIINKKAVLPKKSKQDLVTKKNFKTNSNSKGFKYFLKIFFSAIIAPIMIIIVLGLGYLYYVLLYLGPTDEAINEKENVINLTENILIKNDVCKNEDDCDAKQYILYRVMKNNIYIYIYSQQHK
ncbi:putative membrane protein [Campylobacter blaseri]|uniref:Uncharacterized protein n=1 Tax=Campylobacter blaseri TaxID=2042961 RepID=A0A2P8R0H3_9BACT|nr:hypothetical protein [Campylobacter blaseri]PSM51996.1 hypothetical protein CQ405_05380 [Campylobacter blaseri]PSM53781.1 hypothetical protein CRN67_05380 [Campylobacter blaseri]QKF85665.1 putative membrane protein [Campylobacter blaseri]